MPIYFIADLHLSESHPQLTALFQKFIQEKAVHAQAVYILGDLFDFWIGDDENSPLVQTIKQTIRGLTERGIACLFYPRQPRLPHRQNLCPRHRHDLTTRVRRYRPVRHTHPTLSRRHPLHRRPFLSKIPPYRPSKIGCNACSCSCRSHSG